MPITVDQLAAMLQAEYTILVGRFALSPIPLDVYEIDDDGGARKTALGTDVRNPTPGYTPARIVLPQASGDLASWGATAPSFPPQEWDRHVNEWPAWRTELWHEVVHQYQHQILRDWDPNDGDGGHAGGWPSAVAAVAASFGLTPSQLLRGVL